MAPAPKPDSSGSARTVTKRGGSRSSGSSSRSVAPAPKLTCSGQCGAWNGSGTDAKCASSSPGENWNVVWGKEEKKAYGWACSGTDVCYCDVSSGGKRAFSPGVFTGKFDPELRDAAGAPFGHNVIDVRATKRADQRTIAFAVRPSTGFESEVKAKLPAKIFLWRAAQPSIDGSTCFREDERANKIFTPDSEQDIIKDDYQGYADARVLTDNGVSRPVIASEGFFLNLGPNDWKQMLWGKIETGLKNGTAVTHGCSANIRNIFDGMSSVQAPQPGIYTYCVGMDAGKIGAGTKWSSSNCSVIPSDDDADPWGFVTFRLTPEGTIEYPTQLNGNLVFDQIIVQSGDSFKVGARNLAGTKEWKDARLETLAPFFLKLDGADTDKELYLSVADATADSTKICSDIRSKIREDYISSVEPSSAGGTAEGTGAGGSGAAVPANAAYEITAVYPRQVLRIAGDKKTPISYAHPADVSGALADGSAYEENGQKKIDQIKTSEQKTDSVDYKYVTYYYKNPAAVARYLIDAKNNDTVKKKPDASNTGLDPNLFTETVSGDEADNVKKDFAAAGADTGILATANAAPLAGPAYSEALLGGVSKFTVAIGPAKVLVAGLQQDVTVSNVAGSAGRATGRFGAWLGSAVKGVVIGAVNAVSSFVQGVRQGWNQAPQQASIVGGGTGTSAGSTQQVPSATTPSSSEAEVVQVEVFATQSITFSNASFVVSGDNGAVSTGKTQIFSREGLSEFSLGNRTAAYFWPVFSIDGRPVSEMGLNEQHKFVACQFGSTSDGSPRTDMASVTVTFGEEDCKNVPHCLAKIDKKFKDSVFEPG
ncbi:MAG: hypothetical protein HY394_04455 [Candidatus Diapherotrites archaeon]|nr:hypothetical protein [Candidatus Diapherotrites archaeon]